MARLHLYTVLPIPGEAVRYRGPIRRLGPVPAVAPVGISRLAIYIQALALELITGLDITTAVVGLRRRWSRSTTVLGGMRAVIWTDVIQFFVTTGGIVVVLGTIVWTFGGNVPEIWRLCADTGHTRLVNLDFSPFVQTTLWWLILGQGLNTPGRLQHGSSAGAALPVPPSRVGTWSRPSP